MLVFGMLAFSASAADSNPGTNTVEFPIIADRFADIQVLRYRVPEFDQLSLQQKKLAYYLTQAGFSGRDIYYDQRYRHNLLIRKTLEVILNTWELSNDFENYQKLVVYAKRFFFSNGIHHHYSGIKFVPECSADYFRSLLRRVPPTKLPLEGRTIEEFTEFILPLIFDRVRDAKLVDLSPGIDNVKASAVNFYEGVTKDEVQRFYEELKEKSENKRLSFGLNSKVVKVDGQLVERKWTAKEMYAPAIQKIIFWLTKAIDVAENEKQKEHLLELIAFYETGDLDRFNRHCIAWVQETTARVDVESGFVEVYEDPLQRKGSFESVVSMKDNEASQRIAAISARAQWFEDQSPISPEHKKKNVVGISAKVISAIGEAGATGPVSPAGINLPNADWIREKHGSKSVLLGNIIDTRNILKARSSFTEEFSATPQTAERTRKYGALGFNLHGDMHEVIGHGSGRINDGVGTPDKTLQTYASTIEEGRADLVALYFALDPKLVEIGVMQSLDVAKAEYDEYILNGLMTQLYRIKSGENLEEAHMRDRQIISSWVYEKGKPGNVIERFTRDGKTYIRINDYEKLRRLFGDLLREFQRIKSEGDFEAARNLVESYGVKVDQELLAEVHRRCEKLDIAPYEGYIQPRLVPLMRDGEITDVRIEYPSDFLAQMLEYGEKYAFLPINN